MTTTTRSGRLAGLALRAKARRALKRADRLRLALAREFSRERFS